MKELAKTYFLEKNCNCAESVLRAANDTYELDITEADVAMISGFGGGMGCGKACGALCGAVAALGKAKVEGNAHVTEGFREACAKLATDFEANLGSTQCADLKPKYFTQETRCSAVVESAAELLEEILKPAVKLPTAEEIKKVKGMGFLNQKGTNLFNARVITGNGKVTSKEMEVIAEAAHIYGTGEIALTGRMTFEVQGVPFESIARFQEFIADAGLETGGTGAKVRPVVSCKGTTCQYGLCDTFALSQAIHDKFYKGYETTKLPHKFKIAVGGCPNNCVKPDLNDVGIIGQSKPVLDVDLCKGCGKCAVETGCAMKAAHVVDGKLVIDSALCNNCGLCVKKCHFGAVKVEKTGYKVLIGGRWGKKAAVGQAFHKLFTEEEVMEAVEKIICFYRDNGTPGERFADTIARIGFDKIEATIVGDE